MRIFEREYVQEKGHVLGTHRTRSPEQTWHAFSSVLPRLGITRLANVTGLDSIGLPVFMSVRPNSRSLAVSQGKGFDVMSARVSAMMESIEMWHAENIALPTKVASYADLRGSEPVVDVYALSRMGPVDEHAKISWLEGWDLINQRNVWVPKTYVDLDWASGAPNPNRFLRAGNGLASGNHVLEATAHALCELIERDAEALWALDGDARRTKATQVDPETINDPDARSLLQRVVDVEAFMALWDITSDIGIPTYACMVLDGSRWRAKSLTHGFGTHLSPQIAMTRALTEAAQCRLTEIAGSRDDIPLDQYEQSVDPRKIQRIIKYLKTPPPTLDFSIRSDRATGSFEGDVEVLLDALQAAGLDSVIVVDLTREDVGVPVVKAIVPGLEICLQRKDVPHGPRALRRLKELDCAKQGAQS